MVLKYWRNFNWEVTSTETMIKIEGVGNEEPVQLTIFRQLNRSLRYLCQSKPGICFVLGLASRFMSNPMKIHLINWIVSLFNINLII